jgi:membrane protease subunit (stomatin/prohibitin family)
MGIMNFVKQGVSEMMIARPDQLKHLIVYKHPDQNVPAWSQLTVDSDECALFFKDGKYQGWLPTGRHTLSSQNIPFLNNLINNFTGGNVFIAEIYFVKTQPIRSIPFGGKLESMEDPILFEFVTPRIHGEFSAVITDPVRFVIGYHGQAAGAQDNDVILDWVKRLLMKSTKTVIGQMCAQSGRSLLNLGGMTEELAGRMVQSAPELNEIGIKILQVADFNLNFSGEDEKLLREANKARADARRGVGIAADTAKAKQFDLDQRFGNDQRYVQQLAGNYTNYAAGQAMMGAGQGMAKGEGGGGVAALGAQMAVGMGMGNMMAGAGAGGVGVQPQFAVGAAPQQGGYPAAPQGGYPAAPGGAPAAPSLEDRLAKLVSLKEKGLINDEEFASKKNAILAEI